MQQRHAEAGRVASRLGVMPVPPVVAGMSTGNLGHLHGVVA